VIFCFLTRLSRGPVVVCPICQKRKPGRFCPAKADKICAVCCGTEREVTIDCPPDCGYITAAHRYEDQHPRTLSPDTPLLDVRLTSDVVHANGQLLSAVAFTIAKFCAQRQATTDPDVLRSLEALAETYKTLSTGIIYEQRPAALVQGELYDNLARFLEDTKRSAAQNSGARLRDSEILQLLVFLFRMGLLRANGRPRSRRFIEFLRGQFPGAQELKREESRIIVP